MAGAGILQDIPKMIRLTEKVVKSTSLPVTVKTRLGWDENSLNIEEVAEKFQHWNPGIVYTWANPKTNVQR